MSYSRFIFIGVMFAFLTGCSRSDCSLSGKVSFQGKPIVYGSVVALAQNQQSFQGPIRPDGTYLITEIPAGIGQLRLTVHSPDPNPITPKSRRSRAKGIGKQPEQSQEIHRRNDLSAHWFPIPEKYTIYDEAGLTVMIADQAVTYDIELK